MSTNKEASMSSMFGQSKPKVRIGGEWVYLDHEDGVGPEAEQYQNNGGGEGEDLSKLSRAELDLVAEERGLDPTEYKNRDLLLEALGG